MRRTNSSFPLKSTEKGDYRLATLFGFGLGLGLLKFGNPVILNHLVTWPENLLETIFISWPLQAALFWVLIFGMGVCRWGFPRAGHCWLLFLAPLWLVWQGISAANSAHRHLWGITLIHFTALLIFFETARRWSLRLPSRGLWMGLIACFCYVLWLGFEQHFGGLEATRQAFYAQPDWQNAKPEYLLKIKSTRIFSSLVYPNALAGAILLFFPFLIVASWKHTARLSNIPRGVLLGSLIMGSGACLYWSGSKAGWLIALVLVLVPILQQPVFRRWRGLLIILIVLGGISAFAWKFQDYFAKGATSASARLIYWKSAVDITADHPILGTGPGTFSVEFSKRKPSGAEMAKLTHNDYLEQASDSGLPGFILFSTFLIGSVIVLGRRVWVSSSGEEFGIWIGLFGYALQSFVEFGLYIPALSWAAFFLLGWLWGRLGPQPTIAKATG